MWQGRQRIETDYMIRTQATVLEDGGHYIKSEESIMNKAVITVVGKDTVGIIAKVCTYLANNQVNILDISQTIVQDYFTMMMVVDINNSMKEFKTLSEELTQIGEEIGVVINLQKEEIFNMMHRV